MARKKGKKPRRRAGGRSWPRRLLLALLVLLVLGAAGAGGAAWYLWPRCEGAECPSVASLRDHDPPQATRVFDREGALLAHLASERRIVVPLARIPAHVSGAFLAVEDKRFYDHAGVDWRRVAGAAVRNARAMRWDQGFSTVTMQLARNVFPEHLSRAKTLRRKAWEVVLARRIEAEFRKDEILELYLNQIYLGEGLYGVEAAAQGYFGKRARDLSVAEAATLAALPRSPNHYNPRRNPEGAVSRRNLVLGMMASAGVVDSARAAAARAEPLELAPPAESKGEAPYFLAAVRKELLERFGPDAETRGLRVHTTLDRPLQAAAQRELRRQIEEVEAGKHGRFRGGACTAERADRCLQGMFVAMDARGGEVLALVGGRDYALSQFDRATQARRQAGSAFKPIVYAAALAAGVPITEPLTGPYAVPGEYDDGSYRPADHVADSVAMDLREGLRLSSNRAAVAVGGRVGPARVVQAAHDFGITTPVPPYPSTYLGAAEVVPLELVAAYSAFAAEGTAVRPRLIRRVEDARGRVVWQSRPERHRAVSPEVAFLTTSLMRDVVDRGTGAGARRDGGLPYEVPAAGKTGTTNDATDVWFVGATPDVVAGVWLGFDRPRAILSSASGGGLAAPVWGRVLAEHYRERPAPPAWAPPHGVVQVAIDRSSGGLSTLGCPAEDVVSEYYVAGTEPLDYCPLHPRDGGGWFGRTFRDLRDWVRGGPGEPEPRPHPRLPETLP